VTHPLRVIVLEGDGIGPEVVTEAVRVFEAACEAAGKEVELEHRLFGGVAIDSEGTPLPHNTLHACLDADAILLGAVGGPKWDHLRGEMRCESGLLRLRQELGAYANVRPARVHPALADRSTLKAEVVRDVDLVVVRELTGGSYFGQPKERTGAGHSESAVDTCRYSWSEVERVARFAFELAASRSGRLTSVDKANVMVTSQLWRDVVTEVAGDYPDVALEHQLVDACAMRLVRSPRDFDVIVTENLFGDILTDEAGMLTGSLGMLPSASVSSRGPRARGLYEPIHGSAPDIAGRGIANPLGTILSTAMMARMSLDLPEVAAAIEAAVDAAVERGIVTPDLGGSASTREVGDTVLEGLKVMA